MSSLVYPLLFDHALLLRPSQLASFHHALTTKAWLRPLVKTMWIGHHSLWNLKWPAGLEDGTNESKRQYWIEDGLRPQESSLAPKWVYPGHRWSSNKHGVGSCRDRFVFKAVDAAQEGLGIDLRSPPRSAWAERGGWEKTVSRSSFPDSLTSKLTSPFAGKVHHQHLPRSGLLGSLPDGDAPRRGRKRLPNSVVLLASPRPGPRLRLPSRHLRPLPYPIQEGVERGWDRRLVAARKEDEDRPDTDMWLERRLVAEDEEREEGEGIEREEKKGNGKRRSSERSSRVLTRGRLRDLGEWYSHADLDGWGYS